MPSRTVTLLILFAWVAVNGWTLHRDGYFHRSGDLTYESFLADRAIEEPRHWTIRINRTEVGQARVNVEPQPDGGSMVSQRIEINLGQAMGQAGESAGRVLVESYFKIAAGQLVEFRGKVNSERFRQAIVVRGTIEGRELVLRTDGVKELGIGEVRVPFDPESVTGSSLAPIDRYPSLRHGQAWTSRAVNPLASHPIARMFGLTAAVIEVRHRVSGDDILETPSGATRCWVIESRQDSGVAKTWARQRDGLVLRHEVPIGTMVMRMDLVMNDTAETPPSAPPERIP